MRSRPQMASSIALPHLGDTERAVEMGVRPEHIDVVDVTAGHLTGTADVVEHLGSDTNIYVNVDGLGPLLVRKHGNIPPQKPAIVWGCVFKPRMHMCFQPTALHYAKTRQ